MLEKYDEFVNMKKNIEAEKIRTKKKLANLDQRSMKIKLDQFNKKKAELLKKMNKFVAGQSSY